MKLLAINNGGECLSDIYVNNNSNLKWKCDKDHIWYASANKIKTAKTWCPECNGSKKKTIEEMHNIAESKNGKCLSNKYLGAHHKLLWECEKKHQWLASYHAVKTSNSWCPICSDSKGEKLIRMFLEKNNINFIRQKKFNDCRNKNKLPFDFYLPTENILIEYDGIMHYKPIEYFGGNDGLLLRKKLDLIKNNYCKINNIKLIRIPYFEKDVINILKKSLNII